MNLVRWLRDAISDTADPPFRVKYVDDDPEPDDLGRKIFAIVGTPELRKYAHFQCPCGCGDLIILTSNTRVRPRWTFSVDRYGRPTVHPSVWRTVGCRSHFIVHKGRIVWCRPNDDERS